MFFHRNAVMILPFVLTVLSCNANQRESELDLVSQKGSLWNDPSNVPVCFTNGPSYPTVAKNIQSLLSQEFSRTNRIRLKGFGACGPKDLSHPEIRIEIRASAWSGIVGCSHIGPEKPNSPDGCQLGGGANLYVSGADWRMSIVHEVGHALGFRHEHQRPDRQESCTQYDGTEFQGADRAKMVLETVFDANSVMGYCGPRKALLSELDIQGMNKVYPGPALPKMPLLMPPMPRNGILYTLEFGTNGLCLAGTKSPELGNPWDPGAAQRQIKGLPFDAYPCTGGKRILKFKIEGSDDVKKVSSSLNHHYLVRFGNRVLQWNGTGGDDAWRFVPQESGTFLLQSTADGQCFTLDNKKPAVGSCSSPAANILVTEDDLPRQDRP